MNMLPNEARLRGSACTQCPLPELYLLEVGDLLHGYLLLFFDGVTHGFLHPLQQEVEGGGILAQTTEMTQVRWEMPRQQAAYLRNAVDQAPEGADC